MKRVVLLSLALLLLTFFPAKAGNTGNAGDGGVEPLGGPSNYGDYIEIVGDGHMHTAYSSGTSTVSEMAQKAQERGLDWIFITDGNTIAAKDNCLQETNATFICGLGQEVMVLENGTYTNEIIAWGTDSLVDWYADANHTIGDIIDELHAKGGLAYVPHPFAPDEDDNYDYFGVYDHFDAMSIYHGYGGFNRAFPTTMDGEALDRWDQYLMDGMRRTALGESDCKNADNTPDYGDLFNTRGAIGYPRNYIYAREFTVRGIMEAVRHGRCYVSDGPTMNFTVDGCIMGDTIYSTGSKSVSIEVTGEAVENSVVRIISNGAEIYSESVSQGPFSVSYGYMASADTYLRAEVRTNNHDMFKGETNVAFSNPIYFDVSPYEEVPNPPSNLTAWVDKGDIVLNWTASNSSDVSYYNIYKSDTVGVFDFTYPFASTSKTKWTDFGAGDGDTTDYYYIVRAVDWKLYNDTNTQVAGKYVRQLSMGWNLVSTPLVLSKTMPEDVLQTVNDTLRVAYYYDASDAMDHWKDTESGDLQKLNNTMALWLYTNASDYLVTAGQIPSSTVIDLYAGWNLVGYPSFIYRNLNDTLDGVNWKNVQSYRSGNGGGRFLSNSTGKPDKFNSLGSLETGYGYWVQVSENCEWQVPN
ncbi:MAG: CehA/McbA family metallohydrolase [Thermoplasmata archaeon]|nr:MAG: CehA/McbA family metallohydrolase [Thermoplasmata archaeon]